MIFGSVASGIEAASVGWYPLGWKAAWLAEIDPFASSVLAHHYPDVPNLGDMTTIAAKVRSGAVAAPDVLVGGTPCQSFSIAGLRNSLDDERGQLSLEYVRLLDAIDTIRYVRGEPAAIGVWENVPGVLNTKDNAFGCFLAGLAGEDEPLIPSGGKWTNAGCVYGPKRAVAWRVLDAQYFGVAQRRRRVFVVASARNGFNPAAVLFEFYSLRRDSAPSREARQSVTHDVAPCLRAQSNASHRLDSDTYVATFDRQSSGEYGSGLVASTDSARDYKSATDLVVGPIAFDSRQDCVSSTEVFGALGSSSPQAQAVAFNDVAATLKGGSGARGYPDPSDGNGHSLVGCFKGGQGAKAGGIGWSEHVSPTLSACPSGTQLSPTLMQGMAVRRLTPVECEALQGFPRNYTLVPHRGKPAADGPRYKALGNSMAVPCMRWLGERIQMVVAL